MLYKGRNGKWKAKDIPKDFNPIYATSLVEYFNSLDPLFIKAKRKSEFEFIFSLLNFKGMHDAGWDSFETTQEIFDKFSQLQKKIKYRDEQLYLFLTLYCLIIEASFPYDLIANLLNVASGKRYQSNFPDKKYGTKRMPMSPVEKIEVIKQKAKEVGLEQNVDFLSQLVDRQLRNAVFHSDYCLYDNEVRLPQENKIYTVEQIMTIINKSLAYYETLVKLLEHHKAQYKKSKIIDVHPDFSREPNEKAVVMVRKDTGAIGIKDNLSIEEINSGKIPYRVCRILPYEQKMIAKNPFLADFPANKITKINKILKLFPIPLRKHLIKVSNRYL